MSSFFPCKGQGMKRDASESEYHKVTISLPVSCVELDTFTVLMRLYCLLKRGGVLV